MMKVEAIPHQAGPTPAAAALDAEALADSFHGNADLAPTTLAQRRWGVQDIAALWISMSACIPTYMLASALIDEGMNWWQAVLTIFLGNTIVLVPMVLNAHAGTRYGIPLPNILDRRGNRSYAPGEIRSRTRLTWIGRQTFPFRVT
jgi:NCS1 family nucleobase:cation symporter-1